MEYRKIICNNEEISMLGFGLMHLEYDDGYTYTDSFDDGYGNVMYHYLVSGYTPYKVLVAYRKMTDHEKYLWINGYGYNPFTGKWYNY